MSKPIQGWLIIDSYNLLNQLPLKTTDNIKRKRNNLLKLLEPLAGILAEKITIVFDGRDDAEIGHENGNKIILDNRARKSINTLVLLIILLYIVVAI
jgi:predicted RNA-binding protein with PIN domain